MSMVICESCERLVDSDNDPGCFVEVGNMRRLTQTIILCEWCREEEMKEDERQLMEPPL